MHKLTAVIITLNEERNIERALTSLANVADEVVVYDSFSEDRTQEICKQFDVKFIQAKWEGYSISKNKANQLATHEYILSIDADEALDETLKESINKIKKEGLRGIYCMNRLTNYCGKWIRHSGWYPDTKIRIFPKDKVYWKGDWVHEVLHIPENLERTHLEGNLLHYSYYNYKEHQEKADHYSELTAKKMHEKGKSASFAKPCLSAFARFVSMFIFKKGFLDGYKGFKIAQISAKSNIYKYKKLRALKKSE